jgi:hypothetical protein
MEGEKFQTQVARLLADANESEWPTLRIVVVKQAAIDHLAASTPSTSTSTPVSTLQYTSVMSAIGHLATSTPSTSISVLQLTLQDTSVTSVTGRSAASNPSINTSILQPTLQYTSAMIAIRPLAASSLSNSTLQLISHCISVMNVAGGSAVSTSLCAFSIASRPLYLQLERCHRAAR